MSDKNNVWEDNVPGQWFVDKNCVGCELCWTQNPSVFKKSESGNHAIIYKKITTDAEKAAWQDAMEICPTDSIGNDRF